jgi:hypothetical protein
MIVTVILIVSLKLVVKVLIVALMVVVVVMMVAMVIHKTCTDTYQKAWMNWREWL